MDDEFIDLFSLADEVGWTEETLLKLCLEYIKENCGIEEFYIALKEKADEEFSYDEDDTTPRY